MPKLSVIVPIYNTEKYLQKCIDSILAQTFTDFELILVDDGSPDASGAVCDAYSLSDGRVKVIHQSNGGVTVARKRGVEAAAGEYVSFIDSDDWIEVNMFLEMMTAADTYNADVILCDMLAEKQKDSTLLRSSSQSGLFTSEALHRQIFSSMLFDFSKNAPSLSLNLCNKIIRAALAKEVFAAFPNDVTYGEDALGSLMCLLRSECIFIMEDSAFYHYRQTEDFLIREHSITLLPRLSNFARNTEMQFSMHGFDGYDQLSGYIAQVSLYCIRQILLFNKEHTLRNKYKRVVAYLNEPHIRAMLQRAEPLVTDKTLQRKIKLVNRKRFALLLPLFYGKETLLRIKRCLISK